MEKLTDSEVLARLIYRAYIAPDPHAPLEAEALLPFQAALELYARTWKGDAKNTMVAESARIVLVGGGSGTGEMKGGRGGTGQPIPPHGRLIDADALLKALQDDFDTKSKDAEFSGNRGVSVMWDDAIVQIMLAPTIIPAHPAEEGE